MNIYIYIILYLYYYIIRRVFICARARAVALAAAPCRPLQWSQHMYYVRTVVCTLELNDSVTLTTSIYAVLTRQLTMYKRLQYIVLL